MHELERWSNFYLLTSAAAAALIGLLFVVITLAASSLRDSTKIRIYLTPTIIYFASVLFIAALLTFPDHTPLTAAVCICLFGVTGLFYAGALLIRQGFKKNYYEILDLIPYAGFPFVAYGILVWGGVLMLHRPQLGLTLVAASMLSLLAVAIRNSWAIAINLVSNAPRLH
jgi:hypothetical protein